MNSATTALTGEPAEQPAAPPAAPPAAQPTATTWTTGFDEPTMKYVQNKGWNSPASVLESYRNLEKHLGGSKKVLALPDENADEETMNKFYSKLGRPDFAKDYGFDDDPNFAELAYKNGLSTKQAKDIRQALMDQRQAEVNQIENDAMQESQQAIDTLKQTWGRNYDKNVVAGQKAAKVLGYGAEQLEELEMGMGTGAMLELFSKIGLMMAEPSFVTGQSSDFVTSEHSARQQIDELKSDRQWMSGYLNGDKDKIQKMQGLLAKAYPG